MTMDKFSKFVIADNDFREFVSAWQNNVSNNPQIPKEIKDSWLILGVETNQEALYNTVEMINYDL